ncbi:hypothetical protein OH492_26950 [Vibrio chagasii]|nr:hypothetical protein [Vibrio chagasii]
MLLAHCLDIDWKNPSLYSKLSIENASITHIQVTLVCAELYQRQSDRPACSLSVQKHSLRINNL